ncbi:6945_t:CDS:2, partial [Racocetra fulgida]
NLPPYTALLSVIRYLKIYQGKEEVLKSLINLYDNVFASSTSRLQLEKILSICFVNQ